MRKLYTLMIGVLCAGFTQAQDLYDSFDDVRTVEYGLDVPFPLQQNNGIGGTEWPGWHGVLLQYQNNPGGDDVNGSALCARYERNPAEVFDVILIDCGELADLAPYLTGDKTISMDVYAPVPGITVQFTLQNAALSVSNGYPAGRHSEYQATTSTGGQWETLEFTLTNEPWADPANGTWWPDAQTANNDIDEMVLLFNPGVNISETYYFDNLNGPERADPVCPEVNTDPSILVNADCENDRFYPNYYDGRLSIFPDPAADQDDRCLEYARNGGAVDDVIVGSFNGALEINNTTTLSLDIYDPAAPSQIVFSLQDDFGLELQLYEYFTTESNTWETFEMDLSMLDGLPNVTDFVILIEPGQELAETFYFDNLLLESVIGIDEAQERIISAFPNPATDQLTLNGVEGLSNCSILSADGRIVAQHALRGSRQQIAIDALSAGVYFLQFTGQGETLSQTVRIVKE